MAAMFPIDSETIYVSYLYNMTRDFPKDHMSGECHEQKHCFMYVRRFVVLSIRILLNFYRN